MRFVGAIVVLALIGAMTIASPAAALEPGVFVDPNSPAGKEYSFPLDVQRATAVGRNAPQGVAQPLFGVGIEPAVVGARANGGSRKVGPKSAVARGGSQPARGSSTASVRHQASNTASSRGRPSQRSQTTAVLGLSRPRATTFQVALIVVPLVLGGLLAGVAIAVARRRRT
jgi:hypothetical protein